MQATSANNQVVQILNFIKIKIGDEPSIVGLNNGSYPILVRVEFRQKSKTQGLID